MLYYGYSEGATMVLEALKEVTEWKVDFRQPNHTYLLDGDKLIAYRQWHTGEPIWGTPVRFDRRYRKFIPADLKLFGIVDAPENVTVNALQTVTGSKGDIYYVDPEAKTCTCSGFKFRGRCKHIETLVTEGSLEIG
jgi:hypothetical protein